MVVRQMNRLKRKEEAEAPAPPTTRDCPYCLSSVPLGATRCSRCTSELAPLARIMQEIRIRVDWGPEKMP